jgi:hypothetical protein
MAIKQIRISEVKMADWVLLSMETESVAYKCNFFGALSESVAEATM